MGAFHLSGCRVGSLAVPSYRLSPRWRPWKPTSTSSAQDRRTLRLRIGSSPHSLSNKASLPYLAVKPSLYLISLACVFAAVVATVSPIALDKHAEEAVYKYEQWNVPIPFAEVQRHNTAASAWIVVDGKAGTCMSKWRRKPAGSESADEEANNSVTEFLSKHPGGAVSILAVAGKDASKNYKSMHPPRYLDQFLTADQCIGVIDSSTLPDSSNVPITTTVPPKLPRLSSIVNLDDFESLAQRVLPPQTWAYYSGAADEESSHINNLESWSRYEFRPRVLRKTEYAVASTNFLGFPTTLPIYISPTAAAGLGHPLGEVNMTKAAAKYGIVQGLSNNATRSVEDVAAAAQDGQTLVFQLYVHPDRQRSENLLRQVESVGYKAVILTVDTNALGKREADMRVHAALASDSDSESDFGVARQMGSFFDQNLGWDIIPWLKSVTKLPILLKGIQCVEDVELAHEAGVQGVILSNHGGRQLAYAPAAIDILYELREHRPDLLDKLDVFVDGGVRRGTDVLKALCLGAKGVGLGRPFLYANATHGEAGVARAIAVMEDEIIRGMRLLGANTVDDLKPSMVVRKRS